MYSILHICNNYAGSFVHRFIVEGQKEYGIRSVVFCPITFYESRVKPHENEYIVKCVTKLDRFFFFNKQRKIIASLKKTVCDYSSFDLIHAHSIFSDGYVAYKLNKKNNIPFVLSVSGTDINHFFVYRPYLKGLGNKIILAARRIIVPSESYKRFLLDRCILPKHRKAILSKLIVIPFGIDDFWYQNFNKKKRHIDGNCLKFLFVGEIRKNKNIGFITKAMDELFKNGIESKLTIAGAAIDHNELNKIVKHKNVFFVGQKNKSELLQLYRENDIFIMVSHSETFGLVYAEALSQGMPIIYTKGQGFDGQFENGYVGFSVSDKDCSELVDCIISIRNNYDEYSSNALHSIERFKWNNISSIYNALYMKAIDNGNG